jgi:hypothetical protein
VCDFVKHLSLLNTPSSLIRESLTAVRRLLEIAIPGAPQQLRDSAMLRDSIRAALADVVRPSKYREIWRLEVVLDYTRSGPPSEELAWVDLMERAAFLFMIFMPCRPVGMLRMHAAESKVSSNGSFIQVPTREKTNSGKGSTVLLIRKSPVSNLCAVHVFTLLRVGAIARGVTDSLWCSVRGIVFKQSSGISKLLKGCLRKAGVSVSFPAYSIRHALITYLFDQGLSEIEVNAFTGHSNNSHIALTHYIHLDKKWMGSQIAQTTMIKDPVIEKVIEADNKIGREEKGEEQDPTEPEGM